jgi:methylenetetrahydrofolate--tRNA-(uracil-5-)-methyltransferase
MTHPERHSQGSPVTVVGGGIAGSEAAWQLAIRGIEVRLLEMRPGRIGPAHTTGRLAELVCSNSMKGDDPATATGLLKRELQRLGSLVIAAARATAVPAGAALAVDRDRFAALVTSLLHAHPLVALIRAEADAIPAEGPVIIATGPLTSDAFESALTSLMGDTRLHFFDAAAPIVDSATIDHEVVFAASRWGKGGGADYLNCPMDRETYERFVGELVDARRITAKEFERKELFAACQPVEEIARTGLDALRFGPLKPVGLTDPRTGERPWAVVQLRPENAEGTAHNLVGFQTNLAFPEQRRIFRMIPGLENADFDRYGVMHRNTFVDAPRLLDRTLALREHPRVRIAGQLVGTEGYLEAAAGGVVAGVNSAAVVAGLSPLLLPDTTAFGSLLSWATDPATVDYQPMHVNFGIVPALSERVRGKRDRYAAYAARATDDLERALVDDPWGVEVAGVATRSAVDAALPSLDSAVEATWREDAVVASGAPRIVAPPAAARRGPLGSTEDERA